MREAEVGNGRDEESNGSFGTSRVEDATTRTRRSHDMQAKRFIILCTIKCECVVEATSATDMIVVEKVQILITIDILQN